MDFYLTEDESQYTAALTRAAYDSWVLVNDYFSWEKEYQNYTSSGSTGQIASAVYLFMKWHNIDPVTAKKMLRNEIIAREEKLCKLKSEYLARGNMTDRILKWIELLVLVTAGNFAWSMTTARYHAEAEDAYPGLRAANQNEHFHPSFNSLSAPITPRTVAVTGEHSLESNTREFPDSSESSKSDETSSPPTSCDLPKWAEEGEDTLSTLSAYEGVSTTSSNSESLLIKNRLLWSLMSTSNRCHQRELETQQLTVLTSGTKFPKHHSRQSKKLRIYYTAPP